MQDTTKDAERKHLHHMNDFIFAIGLEKKPGGRFFAVFQEPANDEERIGSDVEAIKINVPEE